MQRRGVILATLSKLKQVCNHPTQFLGNNSELLCRSGKLARLTEMLEEIIPLGERVLIFTQFTEMGTLLRRHLQEHFGRVVGVPIIMNVSPLHGPGRPREASRPKASAAPLARAGGRNAGLACSKVSILGHD